MLVIENKKKERGAKSIKRSVELEDRKEVTGKSKKAAAMAKVLKYNGYQSGLRVYCIEDKSVNKELNNRN